jgi:hypothetical protein
VAFACVAAGLFAGKRVLDRAYERSVSHWVGAAGQYWAENTQTRNRTFPKLWPLEGASAEQVETRLGVRGLAAQQSDTGSRKVMLTSATGQGPEAAGWRLTVQMHEGSVRTLLLSPPPPPAPPNPQLLLMAEQARRLLQWLGPFGWFGALAFAHYRPLRRPAWIQISLAAAIAVALAWWAAVGGPGAAEVFGLAVCTVMVLTSGTLWAWHPRPPADALRGRCVACGYDLTGNESGTCPECGSAADDVESECTAAPVEPVATEAHIEPDPLAGIQFAPFSGAGQPLFASTGGSAGTQRLAHGPLETVRGPVQFVVVDHPSPGGA